MSAPIRTFPLAGRGRWPRWQRLVGRWVVITPADRQRPGVTLNRYYEFDPDRPTELIGLVFHIGTRRGLSWVWPVGFRRG